MVGGGTLRAMQGLRNFIKCKSCGGSILESGGVSWCSDCGEVLEDRGVLVIPKIAFFLACCGIVGLLIFAGVFGRRDEYFFGCVILGIIAFFILAYSLSEWRANRKAKAAALEKQNEIHLNSTTHCWACKAELAEKGARKCSKCGEWQDRTKGDDATGGIGLGIGVSIPLGDSSDD